MNVIWSSVFANWHFLKSGSYSPKEAGDVRTYHYSWRLHFKRVAPRYLRKILLACESGKKKGEDLHLEGVGKEYIIASFLK